MNELGLQAIARRKLLEKLGVQSHGPVTRDHRVRDSTENAQEPEAGGISTVEFYRATLDADGRLRLPVAVARTSAWVGGRACTLNDFPFAAVTIWDPDLWAEFDETVIGQLVDHNYEENVYALRRVYVNLTHGVIDKRNRISIPWHYLARYELSGSVELAVYSARVIVVSAVGSLTT